VVLSGESVLVLFHVKRGKGKASASRTYDTEIMRISLEGREAGRARTT